MKRTLVFTLFLAGCAGAGQRFGETGVASVAVDNLSSPLKTVVYHADHLGSVTVMTDASGNVLERKAYYAFGETTQSEHTRYLFTGQEYDPESGLTYFKARYYDARIGRFLSLDPALVGSKEDESFRRLSISTQAANGYAYVEGQPTKAVDPDGKSMRTGILADPRQGLNEPTPPPQHGDPFGPPLWKVTAAVGASVAVALIAPVVAPGVSAAWGSDAVLLAGIRIEQAARQVRTATVAASAASAIGTALQKNGMIPSGTRIAPNVPSEFSNRTFVDVPRVAQIPQAVGSVINIMSAACATINQPVNGPAASASPSGYGTTTTTSTSTSSTTSTTLPSAPSNNDYGMSNISGGHMSGGW